MLNSHHKRDKPSSQITATGRLAEGEKPPAPRAALALAKSKTYQSAADAPETLRAYKADFDYFSAWCARRTVFSHFPPSWRP